MTKDELLAELLVERYAHLERDLPAAFDELAERRGRWGAEHGSNDPVVVEQARAYRRRASATRRARRQGAA